MFYADGILLTEGMGKHYAESIDTKSFTAFTAVFYASALLCASRHGEVRGGTGEDGRAGEDIRVNECCHDAVNEDGR